MKDEYRSCSMMRWWSLFHCQLLFCFAVGKEIEGVKIFCDKVSSRAAAATPKTTIGIFLFRLSASRPGYATKYGSWCCNKIFSFFSILPIQMATIIPEGGAKNCFMQIADGKRENLLTHLAARLDFSSFNVEQAKLNQPVRRGHSKNAFSSNRMTLQTASPTFSLSPCKNV